MFGSIRPVIVVGISSISVWAFGGFVSLVHLRSLEFLEFRDNREPRDLLSLDIIGFPRLHRFFGSDIVTQAPLHLVFYNFHSRMSSDSDRYLSTSRI